MPVVSSYRREFEYEKYLRLERRKRIRGIVGAVLIIVSVCGVALLVRSL